MVDTIKHLIQYLRNLPTTDSDRIILNAYIDAYESDLYRFIYEYYSASNNLSEKEFIKKLNELRIEIDMYIYVLKEHNNKLDSNDLHTLNENIKGLV